MKASHIFQVQIVKRVSYIIDVIDRDQFLMLDMSCDLNFEKTFQVLNTGMHVVGTVMVELNC